MDWKIIYRDLKKINWIILLLLSSISFVFLSNSLTIGVILGGLIIIANFSVFQHTIQRAFSPEGVLTTHKVSIIMKYYFRLLVMGVLIYLLITRGLVHPLGLAVGLSTVMISIIIFGINRAWKTFAGEAS
ncbi:MAG: ATP synthase subunit I [Thermodesulfobacteriota bacterium]|nr:ATP synthase subunit I [Thermodesulfobacteriota bacterium]